MNLSCCRPIALVRNLINVLLIAAGIRVVVCPRDLVASRYVVLLLLLNHRLVLELRGYMPIALLLLVVLNIDFVPN